MAKGMFIVIDGIDGSGKSEIVKMLHNYLFSKSVKIRDFRDTESPNDFLVNKKYEILMTREPTDGAYGIKIREMLRKEKDPNTNSKKMMGLFIKDRDEHLKKTIGPFLENSGKNDLNIVICDRYYYSTIAFQSAQGFGIQDLINKNKKFRKPDIAFILDVEPSIALERIQFRQKEKFERLDFMKKTRANFLSLPELLSDNIKIIDSSKSLNEVFNDIKKEIDNML